ncbi:MAG: hypothetical protein ACTSQJ_03595 [Promethearchaeota archaeon]
MDNDSPKKEITDLEDTVKGLLNGLSNSNDIEEPKLDTELSGLENVVKGALTELTDLETHLLDLIAPSTGVKESNYLMAVRRFQNAMKVAIIDGASKRDINTFNEGFNFYNNAIEIVLATGNQGEIDQVRSEFAQTLFKVLEMSEKINDSSFNVFVSKACQVLAEIYDSFEQYNTGLEFHNRAGDLMANNPIAANFEYFQTVLDYILLKDFENATYFSGKIKLKPIVTMGNDLFNAINNESLEGIDKVKTKIEVMGAQRGIDVKNLIRLLEKLKTQIAKPIEESHIETIQIPSDAIPLSSEKINAIKASLSKSIQQIQSAHPNIQIPISAQIDTSSIITELKAAISSEISREIKSLSQDIVSKILSSIPKGGPVVSSSGPKYAGNISDEGVPDIEIVEGAPGEKPKRPKLDDMLDSIIVSE